VRGASHEKSFCELVYIVADWDYHCCNERASNAHSESVFVVLDFQHSMGMRRNVMCGLLGSTMFFYTIS
jgi:hypothetical protein